MTSETSEPTAALDELERATLLTHTRYPRLGSWYPPAAGAFVGAWIAVWAAPTPARFFGFAALIAIEVAAAIAYTRKRGVLPDMRKAPAEIRHEVKRFLIGVAIFAAIVAMLWLVSTWWIASLVGAVLAAIAVAAYERRYAAAARAAEVRNHVIETTDTTDVA